MSDQPTPIPMRIPCPRCGELHIDAGEFATKPHHTHACQECGEVWRPAVVPTVGVRFLPGFKNAEGAEVRRLREEATGATTVDARLVDAIDDALNHHASTGDAMRIPRWKSERVAALVNELTCGWVNVGLQMPRASEVVATEALPLRPSK